MKKVLIVLSLCLAFGATAAFAGGDVAEYYSKRCGKCHGEDGSKTSGPSGGVMLKGQSAEDIKAKLMGYKDGSYGGKRKKTMTRMVEKLDDKMLSDLANHIGGF